MSDIFRPGGPRPGWMAPLVVVGVLLVLVVLPLVASYNGLVDKEAQVDRAFGDLDAALQRRNDLIPNLVASVRGILNQEQAVFGELARARAAYARAGTTEEKVEAGTQLDDGFSRLLAIVESYPQLRSAENVRALQDQLEGTENRINQARREYNAAVTDYNASIRRFPRSVVAAMFGFDPKSLFRADPGARDVPTVDLETGRATTSTLR